MARLSRTDDAESRQRPAAGNGRPGKLTAAVLADMARQQVEQLTGHAVESVSGLSRHQDGWTITVEALELQRVPPTTDILATYRVELDADGDLMGYERISRYYRNQAGGDS